MSAGITGKGFSLNGVHLGEVVVQENDTDGVLVNAINTRSASHGVMASVVGQGRLTLASLFCEGTVLKAGETIITTTRSGYEPFRRLTVEAAASGATTICR